MHTVIQYYINLVCVAKKWKYCFSTHSVHHCIQAIYGGNKKNIYYCMLFIITSFKWYVMSPMFVTRHVPMCQMLKRKYVYNFIVRIERSNNVIIRYTVSYDAPFTSNIWQYWYRMTKVYNSVFLWLKKMPYVLQVHIYIMHRLLYVECLFL